MAEAQGSKQGLLRPKGQSQITANGSLPPKPSINDKSGPGGLPQHQLDGRGGSNKSERNTR